MEVFPLIVLFFLHWLGDFVCQTAWMAENKHRKPDALALHVLVYTAVLTAGTATFARLDTGLLYFALLNFTLHGTTDLVTSKVTRFYWNRRDLRRYFSAIGFDQFAHHAVLLWTASKFLTFSP